MIGKIYITLVPYYDRQVHKIKFKNRPMLVIGNADSEDYIVLPISSVSIPKNRDPDFDVEVNPNNYIKLKLTKISFVRTHKSTTMHQASLVKEIADLKTEYPNLFFEIMCKFNQFSNQIVNKYIEDI